MTCYTAYIHEAGTDLQRRQATVYLDASASDTVPLIERQGDSLFQQLLEHIDCNPLPVRKYVVRLGSGPTILDGEMVVRVCADGWIRRGEA